MNSIYTGREIAIFTDCYGMGIPLYYVLEDIRKRGIVEIYSLGNAIGFGPNSDMIIDMFEENNVKAIAGVVENYFKIGINVGNGIDRRMLESYFWLKNLLGTGRLNFISNFSPSIDVSIRDRKIGLCSFACDIRVDSSCIKEYTNLYRKGMFEKFLDINGKYFNYCLEEVRARFEEKSDGSFSNDEHYDFFLGNTTLKNIYSDININPIFNGKVISSYDDIIQGSTGREYFEKCEGINIYSFAPICFDTNGNVFPDATYYILREKKSGGFDIQTVAVSYDFDMMCNDILKSEEPTGMVRKMILKK